MSLEKIVVAADESDASRLGARTAFAWGARLRAAVTLCHIEAGQPGSLLRVSADSRGGESPGALDRLAALERWAKEELADAPEQRAPRLDVGDGLPGIELPRLAEQTGAGLLVVGRRPSSPTHRQLDDATGDAVARRSTVPCLLVRQPLLVPARLLVAIDGTDRGMGVLRFALEIARRLGARLSGVIVERPHLGESPELARLVPTARTAALECQLDGDVEPLVVRRGDPVTEILRVADDTRAEVIVTGYRRGGRPNLPGGGVWRAASHTGRNVPRSQFHSDPWERRPASQGDL